MKDEEALSYVGMYSTSWLRQAVQTGVYPIGSPQGHAARIVLTLRRLGKAPEPAAPAVPASPNRPTRSLPPPPPQATPATPPTIPPAIAPETASVQTATPQAPAKLLGTRPCFDVGAG